MSDWVHRALSGQTHTRAELIAAGLFVVVWFTMDVIQFVDWIFSHTPSCS